MHLCIINGPNLNLVGTRETSIYGSKSMDEIIGEIIEYYSDHHIEYFQSNHEGHIIDKLHDVGFRADGIILNAGAYTHTSIAIADAIKAITSPVIELHISDINKRESYRKVSYIKEVCIHHIIGKGVDGYKEGVEYFLSYNSI